MHGIEDDLASTVSTDRNPLHADFYADAACQARVRVVENVRLARDTYRVRFECPEIARRIVPGQFLMLRLAGLNDPLLGRPLALYDTVRDAAGTPSAIDVVYLALGKMTRRLARCRAGDELEVWGPLGNGFPPLRDRAPDHGRRRHRPDAVSARSARSILGLRQYGDPPRARAACQARHALLWRANGRPAGRRARLSTRPASTCA